MDKIIDSHVHLFPNKLFNAIWDYFEKNYWNIYKRIYSSEFSNYLGQFNVERYTSLLYAHKPNISYDLNNWIAGISKSDFKIIPFGTIHPDDSYFEKELERILNPKKLDFKGIKIQLMVTDFDPNIPKLDIMYENLEKYDKILVIHAGKGPTPEYCRNKSLKMSPHVGIEKIYPILERFPNLKLQIPHIGAIEYDEMFELAQDYKNVYLDTAMMLIPHNIFPCGLENENMIDKIIELQNKILFGSDFPNIPYSYEFCIKEMQNLQKLGLNEKILKKIMYKNAESFYML
ncbi:MAG: amidohydrolase family protein [Promethearchaeota archaeon]